MFFSKTRSGGGGSGSRKCQECENGEKKKKQVSTDLLLPGGRRFRKKDISSWVKNLKVTYTEEWPERKGKNKKQKPSKLLWVEGAIYDNPLQSRFECFFIHCWDTVDVMWKRRIHSGRRRGLQSVCLCCRQNMQFGSEWRLEDVGGRGGAKEHLNQRVGSRRAATRDSE